MRSSERAPLVSANREGASRATHQSFDQPRAAVRCSDNGVQQEALQLAKATLAERRPAERIDVLEGREVSADRVVRVRSLHDQGPTRLMRAACAKTVTGIRAGMRGCNVRYWRGRSTRRRRVNHAEREQGISDDETVDHSFRETPIVLRERSDRCSREKYELPLTRAGTVRAEATERMPTRDASPTIVEVTMRELPTRTSGVVSVRPLERGQRSNGQVPRASAASGQDASATRRPLKLLRFPAVRERTGLSRSTIWRLERRGEFPKHHRISPNVVAWVEEDVSEWIERRVNEPAVQYA
jgi:prophage regulatory protein